MRPQIQELVDGILDEMIDKGPPADLVRDFALPVPSLVISLLLGVPYEDHEFFQHHSTVGLDSRSSDEQKLGAIMALFGYILELVARKQREPGDDLISRLVTDYVATGELSRETAGMNGVILLQAGHETTASMIALGTLALLQHPDDIGTDATDRRPGLHRERRRGAHALPHHRAQPGRPRGHRRLDPRRPADSCRRCRPDELARRKLGRGFRRPTRQF